MMMDVSALRGVHGLPLRRGRVHEAEGPLASVFALMMAAIRGGRVLWIAPDWGADCLLPGGMSALFPAADLLVVRSAKEADTLTVAEEALKDGALSLVVIETTRPLSLRAGRRLQLAALAGLGTAGKRPEKTADPVEIGGNMAGSLAASVGDPGNGAPVGITRHGSAALLSPGRWGMAGVETGRGARARSGRAGTGTGRAGAASGGIAGRAGRLQDGSIRHEIGQSPRGGVGLCLTPAGMGSPAAETRWHCSPIYQSGGPAGSTLMRWEIKKNKSGTEGAWYVRWDAKAHRLDLVSPAEFGPGPAGMPE